MRRALSTIRLTLSVVLLAAATAAAQQVTLERDSPLYAEPRLDAPQVTQLKQGATGEVVAKQGGWLNLKTPGGAGWLFSFNVRFPAQKAEGGESGGGSALGRVFSPRRPASVTSTIGIRGLEEEDLKQASFNAGQMKLLDGFVASKQAAEERARTTGLAPATVEYLDAKK
ncbi:MAG TPA: SH3 domain-containing protein [Burkholderiales bacterium]|nr:SH3 domain-containing protein [Burkholderiales bacterium]